VGGDGSTRRYTFSHDSMWGAPSLDRPDSIKQTSSGWERILGGGVKVEFDAAGRHIATVNRLTHRTEFRYDTDGRVKALAIPQAGAGREFTFEYGADGRLERTLSPGVDSARTVTLHRTGARIDAITDPDRTTVRFGYADPTSLRVASRTDRRGYRTDFAYGARFRLTGSKLWMHTPGSGENISQDIRPVEGLGLAAADGSGALPRDSAYALLDGPRPDSDARDHTRLWLNRWGAPVRIVDAVERETLLTRGDPRFPALVTRMDGPLAGDGRRRTVSAVYDARGNLTAQTDSSTSSVRASNQTVYATTSYAYEDPHWPDFATRIVQPEGDTTTVGYDPSTGHRLWQQVGNDLKRRVSFAYYTDPSEAGYAPGLLKSITLPPSQPGTQPAPSEKVEYDSFGNVRATATAREFRTEFLNDDLGRVVRVRTPIDGNVVQTDTTVYDDAGRVSESRTIGPALNGAPQQTLWVTNRYDEGGNLRFVERRSIPDSTRIGQITTEFRYDAAGRKRAEFSPDSTPADTTDNEVERWTHDEAGNVRTVRTRRGLLITMTYDAANRLRTRGAPAVSYALSRAGIPSADYSIRGAITQLKHAYPMHPNDGAGGYTVPAVAETLGYDSVGNLVVADNGDARVRRVYNLDGTLQSETQSIRTQDGDPNDPASFTHTYPLVYRYDLNGQRVELTHPGSLAPSEQQNHTRYAYDPATGALAGVTDPLGREFRFAYSDAGQLDTLGMPAGVAQTLGYDADGNLKSDRVWHTAEGAFLRDAGFVHDQRGRVLESSNTAGSKDRTTNRYSGLGHLVRHTLTSTGTTVTGTPATSSLVELFSYDGLGNRFYAESQGNVRVVTAGGGWLGYNSSNSVVDKNESSYERATGRLKSSKGTDGDRVHNYDPAGNVLFVTAPALQQSKYDRVAYYAADEKLRASETRTVADPDNELGSPVHIVFEEYRYDALGRRVWVRARRFCANDSWTPECNLEKVRRTVWDGDHELYEIQAPAQYRESDGGWPALDLQGSGTALLDPNPFFGRVVYTYGMGVDRPLSVVRMGYVDRIAEDNSAATPRTVLPFSLVPLWGAGGNPDGGYFADTGARRRCEQDAQGKARCVFLNWPGSFFAYKRPSWRTTFWHGTLLEEKRDETGTLYRRNRYYDPSTGRFTQEDPIGLAGGLNLYGFANGDPVSYSDPYGLCSKPKMRKGEIGICIETFIKGAYLGTGDDREFSSSGGSYRTGDRFSVDPSTGSVGPNQLGVEAMGTTYGIFRGSGSIFHGKVQNGSENTGIVAMGMALNGLTVPPVYINYSMSISVSKSGDVSVTGGTHDGFPSYEVWVYREGKKPQMVYGYNQGYIWELAGDSDVRINKE
jgi:RHS repeat-associated protein